MSPSLLVLGGTGFVGPAVVADALGRGWEVATFNRGHGGRTDGVRAFAGDRLDPDTLAPLCTRDWDVVLDTWSGAPRAVRDSARLLAERTRRYVYISSGSVYAPPPPPLGVTEDAPTVASSHDAEAGEYPENKRGAELAAAQAFGDRALLLRAGTILGPGEDVGRLPWWLDRMARGGAVLAPGPPKLALQLIDCRDLAAFALDAAGAGVCGSLNTVSMRGHATIETLLQACREAAGPAGTELHWVDPEVLLAAGVEPWTELPIWIPPGHEYSGLHAADVSRAHAAGLRCRPVADTVRDTWAWLQGLRSPRPMRAGLTPLGLDPARERALLAAVG